MSNVDHVSMVRSALGAASASTDPLVATFYLSAARIAFALAKQEIDQLGVLLEARELEAIRASSPKVQLEIAAEGKAR